MERDKTGRLSPGWQWKRDTGTSRAVARAGQRECVSLQWSLLPLSSLPSLPTTHALLKFFQGPGKEKETYKYWSSGALPVSKYVIIIWSSLFGDRRWEWSTSLPRWRNWDAKKWNHLFRVTPWVSKWYSQDLNSNLTDSIALFLLLHSIGGIEPGFSWPQPLKSDAQVCIYLCAFFRESLYLLLDSLRCCHPPSFAYTMLFPWRWWPLSWAWKIGQDFMK